LGPVIEHSGDGTFLQQMSLFASAMIIMGPHGAGLSNAIAMSEGSIMIEIIPEVGSNAFNMCYMALAYNLNLKYFALRAPHFDSEGTATLPLHYLSSLPFFESHTP
jgi:capsular polysaccharide biosynthesis protein